MSRFTTVSRTQFDLADPKVEMIRIEDIAYALSRICRYGGHAPTYYTVGQHSLLVSDLCRVEGAPAKARIFGLLHDAAEAYVGDVISPLKGMLGKAYAEIEDRVHSVIMEALGLTIINPKEAEEVGKMVTWADHEAYRLERDVIWEDPKEKPPGYSEEFWFASKNTLGRYLGYDHGITEAVFLEQYVRLRRELTS